MLDMGNEICRASLAKWWGRIDETTFINIEYYTSPMTVLNDLSTDLSDQNGEAKPIVLRQARIKRNVLYASDIAHRKCKTLS